MSTDLLHKELSDVIISSFYTVYNALGYGFLEKVYENALYLELNNRGLHCEKQKPIKVYYDQKIVGEYFADMIVENTIILELKAAESLMTEHEVQLINYLKTTEIGMLLNFGKNPSFKRKIFTNNFKTNL